MATWAKKWVDMKWNVGEMDMTGEIENGERILEITESLEIFLVNTGFRKKDEHLLTDKSGGKSLQIDYIFVRQSNEKQVINCKVYIG